MAIVKGKSKADAKDKKAAKKTEEVVEKKATAKAAPKKETKKTEVPEKPEISGVENINTNPYDFLFTVKLDSKKYFGRNADQVEALVFGAMGAVKKITIEKAEELDLEEVE